MADVLDHWSCSENICTAKKILLKKHNFHLKIFFIDFYWGRKAHLKNVQFSKPQTYLDGNENLL